MVVSFIFGIMLAFSYIYVVMKMNDLKFNIKKVAIFCIVFSGVMVLVSNINGFLKVIVIAVVLEELIHRMFKVEVLRAAITGALSYFIIAIGDTASLIVLHMIMKLDVNTIKNNPAYTIWVYIIILVVAVICAHLMKGVNKLFLVREKSSIGSSVISMVYITISIVFLALAVYIYGFIPHTVDKIYMILFVVDSVGFVILNVIVMFINRRYIVQRVEFEQLKLYTGVIEQLVDDVRKFRHDYINILLAINGYADNEDVEALKGFINDELLPESKMLVDNNILSLQKIKNPSIKGIFSSKVIHAEGKGIKVITEINEDINNIPFKAMDAIKIFGIFLDNAIEAATESENKLIRIGMVEVDGFLVAVVANTFKEKPEINRIFEKGYSSKGEGRGIGLATVSEILKSYNDRVMLNTFIEEDCFVQELNLKL